MTSQNTKFNPRKAAEAAQEDIEVKLEAMDMLLQDLFLDSVISMSKHGHFSTRVSFEDRPMRFLKISEKEATEVAMGCLERNFDGKFSVIVVCTDHRMWSFCVRW